PVPGQYSSARDLSIIARAAYANPTIRSIVCLPKLVFRYANGRTRELENTNKLLMRLPYCNGMKTGYTEAAGKCLISSGTRPGRDVIAVVLGDGKGRVWQDSDSDLRSQSAEHLLVLPPEARVHPRRRCAPQRGLLGADEARFGDLRLTRWSGRPRGERGRADK